MTVYALSTGSQIGLGLFGLAVVIFALVSSIWLPRRNPDFPGRHLTAFVLVSVCVFVAMLFAVFYFGRESHEEGRAAEPAQTRTDTSETTPTETTTPATGEPGEAELTAGRSLFGEYCAACHTLAEAKSSGTVGPNLDQAKPAEDAVARQVEHGGGAMPAFAGTLTPDEIETVSAYVAAVAGS